MLWQTFLQLQPAVAMGGMSPVYILSVIYLFFIEKKNQNSLQTHLHAVKMFASSNPVAVNCLMGFEQRNAINVKTSWALELS